MVVGSVVASRILSSHTEKGYTVHTMPKQTWGLLRAFYGEAMDVGIEGPDGYQSALANLPVEDLIGAQHSADKQEREQSQADLDKLKDIYKKKKARKTRPLSLQINQDQMKSVEADFKELEKMVSKWAGQEFEIAGFYGIRVYQNGSLVVPHVDFFTQSVISVTMLLGEDTDEPWPLEIESASDGSIRQVVLKPGEMVFYEGAKLFHGRVTPMRGRHYGIVTASYKPSMPYDMEYGDILEAATGDFKPGEFDCLKEEEEDVEKTCPASSLADSCGSVQPGSTAWEDYLAQYWNKRGVGQYELPFQPGPTSLHMHMS